MDKERNYEIVRKAEEEVKANLGAKVYSMLGPSERAALIQDKLPTKPLFCIARIKDILNESIR